MSGEYNITTRKCQLDQNISRVVQRRELFEVQKQTKSCCSKNLPAFINKPIETFEKSYYHKKFVAKVHGDPVMLYHVALHNLFRGKTSKSEKYFRDALEAMMSCRMDYDMAYSIFELKIIANIAFRGKDFLNLKTLSREGTDNKVEVALGRIGYQCSGEEHIIDCDELKKFREELLAEKEKDFEMPNYKDLTGFLVGETAVVMSLAHDEANPHGKAYYLLKFAAVSCNNLRAISTLIKYKPHKKTFYEQLYEKAKNVGAEDDNETD